MKRSRINQLMLEAIAFMKQQRFFLPPFAYWTPDEWLTRGKEADEIRDCMLGWDLTDFGSGEFEKTGLILFTLRNGSASAPGYTKTYCEKIMIARENQRTPMHFHWNKTEDIINRGGGNLIIQLYMANDEEAFSNSPFDVSIDGVSRTLQPGTLVSLAPGESICLADHVYHEFWAEEGHGPVLAGEVSKVNDDSADNRFYEPAGRFPEIDEDETPLHLLCSEYPPAAD